MSKLSCLTESVICAPKLDQFWNPTNGRPHALRQTTTDHLRAQSHHQRVASAVIIATSSLRRPTTRFP